MRHALWMWTLPALLLAQGAGAQTYPAKPVRVVVPFPAGGGADVMTRVVTQKLAEGWGQQIVVDNRAGAGTLIGAETVARAAPDGYTLYMANPAHAINPALRRLPFDALRDFTAISLIATQPGLLVVHPTVTVRNVRELVALARRKPMSYASAGVGSLAHLSAELFASMTGLRFNHVPYKGTAGYLPDLLSGRVDFMFAPMVNVLHSVTGGRLRALAVTSRKRSGALPRVPTMIEAGMHDYQATSWYMLLAPAQTRGAIIDKINSDVQTSLKMPDLQARFEKEGADVAWSTPAEAARFLREEVERWGRVIRNAGIKGE